jgi:hypothetical protein
MQTTYMEAVQALTNNPSELPQHFHRLVAIVGANEAPPNLASLRAGIAAALSTAAPALEEDEAQMIVGDIEIALSQAAIRRRLADFLDAGIEPGMLLMAIGQAVLELPIEIEPTARMYMSQFVDAC